MKAWFCMPVREREDLTRRTLDALWNVTDPTLCGLVAVDCGSEGAVREYLFDEHKAGRIDRLILNKVGTVPQWQKCYAIRQALGMLEMAGWNFFGWIDNDVEVRTGWLETMQAVLREMPEVEIVAGHQDEQHEKSHPTVETRSLQDGTTVRLKRTCNGPLWMMRRHFFSHRGLPPVFRAKCEEGVEDWHYSRMLEGEETPRFGVVDVADHIGYDDSQRLKVARGVVWE